MAYSENKVILKGNVGQDPEMRFYPSGDKVTNLSLCTNSRYTDQNTGQVVDTPEWHRLVCNDRGNFKLAEYAKTLKVGMTVRIEGRLRTRKWQDSNGQDRWTTEIVVRELDVIDQHHISNALKVQQQASQAPVPTQQHVASDPTNMTRQAPVQQQPLDMEPSQDDFDDDIPF